MLNRPRILWLHTQPEHYHNCMMDDLASQGSFEYIAAFSSAGKGSYTEVPIPQIARTIFLRPRPGLEKKEATPAKRYHLDWRADLYPLNFDAAIVSGYGVRTHRELIHDCRRRGIPVAVFADSNLRSQRGRSFKARAKRCVKRRLLAPVIGDANLILPANRLGVAYWRYFGAPASKIILCPYYADYARVAAARETDRTALLQKNNLAPDVRYLFSAARLVSAKGLDLMIGAFRDAHLAERGWHYLIAGVGPLEAALQSEAVELLGKNIHFVGFKQPSENLALMAHADLFVLPSVYEPHGIVIQESLAAGTPVLASDVCGAAYDLVKPNVSGQLFRSGNRDDLRCKLERLLADPARLAAMRTTARAEFDRWFAAYSPITVVNGVVHRLLNSRTTHSQQHGRRMTKQRLIFIVKLIILVGVFAGVANLVYKAWHDINKDANDSHIRIPWETFDWRYSIFAVLGFAGVMLTSGLTWRWLAAKMGDQTPPVRAVGAYTFSQMGKYVPGKIALLLMRIDRASRFGMSTAVCTLSTLLENALYMISGGLVGMLAIAHVVHDLPPKIQPFIWPATLLAILLLASACHPAIFYALVDKLLAKMKKPLVPRSERLRLPTLLLAVVAFTPCWVFGGLALWASASCIHPLPIADCGWFIGAFSLSVIIGMASLIPGGGGVREAVLGAAVALQFTTLMDHAHAVLLGTLVAILQRLFQLVAEIILGVAGSVLTRKPNAFLRNEPQRAQTEGTAKD